MATHYDDNCFIPRVLLKVAPYGKYPLYAAATALATGAILYNLGVEAYKRAKEIGHTVGKIRDDVKPALDEMLAEVAISRTDANVTKVYEALEQLEVRQENVYREAEARLEAAHARLKAAQERHEAVISQG